MFKTCTDIYRTNTNENLLKENFVYKGIQIINTPM